MGYSLFNLFHVLLYDILQYQFIIYVYFSMTSFTTHYSSSFDSASLSKNVLPLLSL